MNQVTIYKLGCFGYTKTEAKLVTLEQKTNGTYVKFVPRGKRKEHFFTESPRNPGLIILTGWNHPAPPGAMVKSSSGGMITKYSSFDPRYAVDFNEAFAPYLATLTPEVVLHDERGTKAAA